MIQQRNQGTKFCWGGDKSLARPGRKEARQHVKDTRDFNNIETRAVTNFFFSFQGKAPKEIHAILAEILACFLPGRAKGLSASLYHICSSALNLLKFWYFKFLNFSYKSWSDVIRITTRLLVGRSGVRIPVGTRDFSILYNSRMAQDKRSDVTGELT